MRMKIVFIILVIVFLYFQHKYINKLQPNIEILQMNNPNKEKFEEILTIKIEGDLSPIARFTLLNDFNGEYEIQNNHLEVELESNEDIKFTINISNICFSEF